MAATALATPWSSLVHRGTLDETEERELLRRLLVRFWKPVFGGIRWTADLDLEESSELTRRFLWTELEHGTHHDPTSRELCFRPLLHRRLQHFLESPPPIPRGAEAEMERVLPRALLAEAQALNHAADTDDAFDWQWRALVVRRGLRELERDLRASGEQTTLRLFALRDLKGDERTNEELARSLGCPAAEIERRLEKARRRLRGFVSAQIDEYATDLAEAQRELTWVLG